MTYKNGPRGARAKRIGAATAVAALALGTTAIAAQPAAASTKRRTLSYTTKLTKLTEVPVSGQTRDAPQPGDYVVITDDYLKGGKVVGSDMVHCILVTTKASLCFAAVSLPKGQIELQGIGPAGGAGDFSLAITGGTGAYARARGTARIKSGANNTGTETFHLVL